MFIRAPHLPLLQTIERRYGKFVVIVNGCIELVIDEMVCLHVKLFDRPRDVSRRSRMYVLVAYNRRLR